MKRRAFLRFAPALAASAALRPYALHAQARPREFADMHSHLGIHGSRVNVREAMTANGMLVIARKVVADGPVIRRLPGGGLQMFREPAPGELASRFDAAFERMREGNRADGLAEVTTAQTLEHALNAREPGAVLAAEGGDFLDGDLQRLEAARKRGLTHLQLVHYRVSELGDICTERPVHGGLTAFGKEVVAACSRLGIVVDVAHATSQGIVQVLEITTRPVVYSHGHVVSAAPYFTQSGVAARGIHRPLAREIAQGGGVIGIWPLGTQYRTLDGYAGALIDTAEALGPAHVGIGSDMLGLGGNTVMPSYQEFAALEGLLAKRGVKPDDVRNMLGGNYLRVLRQVLA